MSERGGPEPLLGQRGYGGGAGGGRYQGFGSTPNTQPDSLVTQVSQTIGFGFDLCIYQYIS